MKLPSAKTYSDAWEKGMTVCRECGALIPLDSVKQLSFNECPKCKKSFFVPKKVGSAFIYEPAGGGGMGSVYKGVSVNYPGIPLAIKLLSREDRESPANVLALLNEARTGAVFKDSEFIAGAVEGGFDNDEYYIVMKFVQGERLDKMIARLGHIREEQLIRLVGHILAGEQHIYRKGYLYRDMKPENIIITPQGYATIIDFGLCIPIVDAKNDSDDYVSGSPYYIPPERLLGQPEDARSEIYSLGMVMYFALTGKTYFDADEANTLAKRHLSNLRISEEAKMAGISPKLAAILGSMIAQDPDKRPASFPELWDTLKALL